MSTLDRIVSGMQAAQEKLRAAIASADQVGATSEAVSDIGHSVGSERHIDGGTAMAERAENGRAKLQAALDRLDELIAEAEALKTAGPSAAPQAASATDTGNSAPPAASQYEVTTGADHKPTPINAVPGHLREPSRKIGDPVKPPHEVSQGKDRGMSRFRRGSRSVARNADGVEDSIKETDAMVSGLRSMDVPPDKAYGVTTTASQPQSVQPTGHQVDSGDALTSATMLVVVSIDILGRIRRKKKG